MYRTFLSRVGVRSGGLFAHDHVDASYAAAMKWTAELRARPLNQMTLPKDAVVILARLGQQFEFLRCSAGDDPEVWYVAEWAPQETVRSHPSFSEWLSSWSAEAEEANPNE